MYILYPPQSAVYPATNYLIGIILYNGHTVPNGQNWPPPQLSCGFVTTPRIFFCFLSKVEELTWIRYSFQLIWSKVHNSKFLRKLLPKSGIHMPKALPHAIYSICSPSNCQQMYILLLYTITEAIVHIWMIDLLRVVHYVEVHHDSSTNFVVRTILLDSKLSLHGIQSLPNKHDTMSQMDIK